MDLDRVVSWAEPCQAKQLLSTVVQKAPHQQFQQADQGDRQKELVVKGVVPCSDLALPVLVVDEDWAEVLVGLLWMNYGSSL